jgi:hypothetical protein
MARGILLILCCSSAVYGQNSPPPVEEAATRLVRLYEAWGPKANTAGASLVIKEASRSGQTFRFRLIASGVPKDAVYSIVTWPVTVRQPTVALTGVTLNGSGLAVCAGAAGTCGSADKPNDPIDIAFQPVPGEPLRLGLVSNDGASRVFAKLVPVPLAAADRGCRIEAVLLLPGAEVVLVVGSGFPPDADLTMDSDSAGERHTASGKANSDGRYISAFLPYVQGVARGATNVRLAAAGCSPTLRFPWGRRN